jgi:hypothetical protein
MDRFIRVLLDTTMNEVTNEGLFHFINTQQDTEEAK